MSSPAACCPRCGEPVIAGARFCARCGLALAEARAAAACLEPDTDPAFIPSPPRPIAPATPAIVKPRRSGALTALTISAIAAVVLIAGGWLLLTQFPRRDHAEQQTRHSGATPDRVEEGSPTTTEPLPLEPESEARPTDATRKPPRTESNAPATTEPPSRRELTAGQAIARLSRWIAVNHYYGAEAGCATLTNQGYRNQGYDIEVDATRCQRGEVDKWRVDSENGEVFRQVPDGRYLRP